MIQIIQLWFDKIVSFKIGIADIPSKFKNDVIIELAKIGFIDSENISDVIDAKIAEMSAACNTIIVAGSDVKLSDGNTYHFSFTTEDQARISALAAKAEKGETFLPWHSDDNGCKIYSTDDITTINTVMESLITYHLTYFNSLKGYVKSLDTTDNILGIEYGVGIPEEYKSEVLKALEANM